MSADLLSDDSVVGANHTEPVLVAEALRKRRGAGDVLEHQRHRRAGRLDRWVLRHDPPGNGFDGCCSGHARDSLHLHLETQRLLQRRRHLHFPELRDREVEVYECGRAFVWVMVEKSRGEPETAESEFGSETHSVTN